MSPRSAWFFSICWRSSGEASKTTPLPKIGVMNGYAAAWSSDRVGCSEEGLVGLGAGDQDDVLVGEPEPPDVAALLADPAEQADRVDPHLRQVSGATDDLRHVGALVVEDAGDFADAGQPVDRARAS